jgi:tetratricopeptide (TPR) repeat protein
MIAFDTGDVETAARLYQRALQRACAMDDSQSISGAAYNLAACEIMLDRLDAAVNHLQDAKYNSSANGPELDEIKLLSAKVAYLRRRDADARSLTQPLCKSDSPMIRVQAQTLLVLISCDVGNIADARSKLKQLQEIILQSGRLSPSVEADVEKARGTVAKLDRQMPAAAGHFDRETELLRASHRYRDVIRSLSRSGSAYDDAGDFTTAADRYYRAALASAAVDDQSRAKDLADKALIAAKAAHNAELASMVRRLIGGIDATTAP